jgi:hypothetical protein
LRERRNWNVTLSRHCSMFLSFDPQRVRLPGAHERGKLVHGVTGLRDAHLWTGLLNCGATDCCG